MARYNCNWPASAAAGAKLQVSFNRELQPEWGMSLHACPAFPQHQLLGYKSLCCMDLQSYPIWPFLIEKVGKNSLNDLKELISVRKIFLKVTLSSSCYWSVGTSLGKMVMHSYYYVILHL